MLKKPIGIGIENYKRITERPYYYVDKTMMIKELLDDGGMVNLFTRPRRFGKTLTLSRIRTFFEKEYGEDQAVIDNSSYFKGMKIMDAGEAYLQHMGCYPVISMTLKSAKQPDYHKAYTLLLREIAREYDRHKYVLFGDALSDMEKRHYQAILDLEKNETLYLDALNFVKNELEKLIAGGTIEKPVHEDITYGEIYKNQDNLWNFLFFTGYLKAVSQRLELLSAFPDYTIRSNRESGNGRPDTLLFPLDETQPVIIVEVKCVETLSQMEDGSQKALIQIAQQDYTAEAQEEGYEKILSYGICFCKKSCIVKSWCA